jgi:hypothetical protein
MFSSVSESVGGSQRPALGGVCPVNRVNHPVKMLSVPSVPEDGAWSCRSGLTLNRPDRAVIPGFVGLSRQGRARCTRPDGLV